MAASVFQTGRTLGASGSAGSDSTRSAELRTERPIPAKVLRYARRLLERYDTDKSGRLEQAEWQRWLRDAGKVDFDRDGVLTLEEIARRIADYGHRRHIRLISPPGQGAGSTLLPPSAASQANSSEDGQTGQSSGGGNVKNAEAVNSSKNRTRRFFVPTEKIPKGLPKWFLERDANGDGQLSLSEFSPRKNTAQAAQFASYDLNGDGLLTAREYLSRASAKKSNQTSAAVKPAK